MVPLSIPPPTLVSQIQLLHFPRPCILVFRVRRIRVADELIFAIRVRKLKYKKMYGFFGDRKLVDEAHNIGTEMVGVDRSARQERRQEDAFDVEEVDLEEEMEGYQKISESNKDSETTWVAPKRW
jgi:hypothetical protein